MNPSSSEQRRFLDQIRDHLAIVHKICSVYTRTPADREDLFQDIILQLWRSHKSFKGESKLSTWMYRVAINTAMMRVRRPELLDFRAGQELDRFAAPPPNAEREQQIEQLHGAIRKLKPLDRAIVVMWLDDLSYREIGDTLGLTEKNVSVKLSRLRARLAAILGGAD